MSSTVFQPILDLIQNHRKTSKKTWNDLDWINGSNSAPQYFVIYMVCTTWDKQISRTFQGFFKDKLQFTRTKIYLINRHSSIPLKHWSHYRPKHVMESFTIFYFFGHTTFRNKTLQNNWVWLIIASEVQNSIWNKETEINYCSCTKMFSCYPWVLQVLIHKGWAKFSSAK